jgi:hypothetical protein
VYFMLVVCRWCGEVAEVRSGVMRLRHAEACPATGDLLVQWWWAGTSPAGKEEGPGSGEHGAFHGS